MNILRLAPLALCALISSASANTIVVTQSGFGFSPPNITINVGDTVMWQWTSSAHTVSEGTDGIVDGNEAFSGYLNATQSTWSFTFDAAFFAANPRPSGLYNYFCEPHFPGMHGTITIAATGMPFCFGDASSTVACPCGNTGTTGRGCNNSAATGGAKLAANGLAAPTDALVLTATNELPTALSIFLQGDVNQAPAAFGDGLRCTGGNLKRIAVKTAVSGRAFYPDVGDASISARSAALGDPIAPGSSRYYQSYYRDASATFCPAPSGDVFNSSSGIAITW